jgi:hypothetical protein
MQRTPVSSNNLRSVGYDLGTQTLEISFKSGGIYQYYYVPANIYQSLMTAVSKGIDNLFKSSQADELLALLRCSL